jgi:hypothetical protein
MARSLNQLQQLLLAGNEDVGKVVRPNVGDRDQCLDILVEGHFPHDNAKRQVFQQRHPPHKDQNASRCRQRAAFGSLCSEVVLRVLQIEPLEVFGGQPRDIATPVRGVGFARCPA